MTLTEARNYLGKFLFSGDEVFKPNNRLSGGERSRLALAKLGLDDGNFLILDEPTNHLDISATEELEKAVRNFPGTLLVVSHDRYFLTRATDKILEVCDGKVELYKMPYGEYVQERENRRQEQAAPDVSPRRARLEQEKLLREQELAVRRQRRRLEQDVSEMECAIADTEQKIAELEKELAEPVVYENFALAREKGEEMYRLKDELEHLVTAWGVLVVKLEQGR
jgi:ATP-binding cassette subfamily F protein 3